MPLFLLFDVMLMACLFKMIWLVWFKYSREMEKSIDLQKLNYKSEIEKKQKKKQPQNKTKQEALKRNSWVTPKQMLGFMF